MTRTQQVVWIIVILVVLGGIFWWWSSSQAQPTAQSSSDAFGQPMIPATSTQSSGAPAAPMSAGVVFNGSSFSPSSVTIAQGGAVTWTSTAGPMWVVSDPAPIGNGYDGTTMQQHCLSGYGGPTPFDECAGGADWSFTFDKVGTWGYYDELQSNVTGSVTVVASQ